MAGSSISIAMETIPFTVKDIIEPQEITEEFLENLIRDIVRKAMKFGLLDYDKAIGIEKSARNLARKIMETLKANLRVFCSVKPMRRPKIAIMKREVEMNVGKISMKFVLINDGERCGIRLVELR